MDTLKLMNKQLKAKRGEEKGFTLMEMLIVVAIIAILIAIAIPLFTAQLDNAKHATATANTRSELAVVTADYMTDNSKTMTGDAFVTKIASDLGTDALQGATVTVGKATNGSGTITVSGPGAASPADSTMTYNASVITEPTA